MKEVTLAVLAGGRGVRMGRAKTELVVRGKAILVELVERIGWAGPTLLVTSPGRERPVGFERFTKEVCDAVEGQGPVRGLMTALEASETERVVVMPVDMPGVGGEQLEWVVGMMRGMGVMLAREGVVEPFPSVWSRPIVPALREHFERGERSMRSLATLAGVSLVEARDWSAGVWQNLNYPEDLTTL